MAFTRGVPVAGSIGSSAIVLPDDFFHCTGTRTMRLPSGATSYRISVGIADFLHDAGDAGRFQLDCDLVGKHRNRIEQLFQKAKLFGREEPRLELGDIPEAMADFGSRHAERLGHEPRKVGRAQELSLIHISEPTRPY